MVIISSIIIQKNGLDSTVFHVRPVFLNVLISVEHRYYRCQVACPSSNFPYPHYPQSCASVVNTSIIGLYNYDVTGWIVLGDEVLPFLYTVNYFQIQWEQGKAKARFIWSLANRMHLLTYRSSALPSTQCRLLCLASSYQNTPCHESHRPKYYEE